MDIALGDSNITESKSNALYEEIGNTSKEDVRKILSKEPELHQYAILMSNFNIIKSRQGGPFFNTQIYKSDSEPINEIDGMMILFNEKSVESINFDSLSEMIKSNNYKLYHKEKK